MDPEKATVLSAAFAAALCPDTFFRPIRSKRISSRTFIVLTALEKVTMSIAKGKGIESHQANQTLHRSRTSDRPRGQHRPLQPKPYPVDLDHLILRRGRHPHYRLSIASLRLPLVRDANSSLHTALLTGKEKSDWRSNSLEHCNLHVASIDDGEDSHVAGPSMDGLLD